MLCCFSFCLSKTAYNHRWESRHWCNCSCWLFCKCLPDLHYGGKVNVLNNSLAACEPKQHSMYASNRPCCFVSTLHCCSSYCCACGGLWKSSLPSLWQGIVDEEQPEQAPSLDTWQPYIRVGVIAALQCFQCAALLEQVHLQLKSLLLLFIFFFYYGTPCSC